MKSTVSTYVLDCSARCWELVTNLKDAETGETFIDVSKIDSKLSKYKSVVSYAWVIHDRDVYTKEDLKKKTDAVLGSLKAEHVHLLMKFDRQTKLSTIARWFGFEDKPNFFEKKSNGKGKKDAYYDCLLYLTHEDEKSAKLGKYRYPDEDIHFYSKNGESFRGYLDSKLNANNDPLSRDSIRLKVLYEGLSITELRRDFPEAYNNDMEALIKRRGDYLKHASPPPYRINIYIEGAAGTGKSVMSTALAKALVDPYDERNEFEVIGRVSGEDSVSFENYDGQDVVIWDDFRSNEILGAVGGKRGEVFKMFSTNPKPNIQKKKYSCINLINRFNIVNSVQPAIEFLDGLSGEYRTKSGELVTSEMTFKEQAYRRFPLYIVVHKDSYDYFVNKGYLGIGSYCEWDSYKCIALNVRQMVTDCGDNYKLFQKLMTKALTPVIKVINDFITLTAVVHSVDETMIEVKYKSVGKPLYSTPADNWHSVMNDFCHYVIHHKEKDVDELFDTFMADYSYGDDYSPWRKEFIVNAEVVRKFDDEEDDDDY